MNPEPLDLPAAVRLTKALVAEYGEGYVYVWPTLEGRCSYTRMDVAGKLHPSCAVGHVAYRHGYPLDLMRSKWEGVTVLGVTGHSGDHRVDAPSLLGATAPAASFLEVFQSRQDEGKPWGQCFDEAMAYVRQFYRDYDEPEVRQAVLEMEASACQQPFDRQDPEASCLHPSLPASMQSN